MERTVNIGLFSVDVELQDNKLLDVYLSYEGSSGAHYKNITSDKAGELLAALIDSVVEHNFRTEST